MFWNSRLWNNLPTEVTSATTVLVFCSRLKTYFLFLSLHDLCRLTLIVLVPLQFLLLNY